MQDKKWGDLLIEPQRKSQLSKRNARLCCHCGRIFFSRLNEPDIFCSTDCEIEAERASDLAELDLQEALGYRQMGWSIERLAKHYHTKKALIVRIFNLLDSIENHDQQRIV